MPSRMKRDPRTRGIDPFGVIPRDRSTARPRPARYSAWAPWFSVNPSCTSDRARPPRSVRPSSSTTDRPALAAVTAAASPANPAPTTTTSLRSSTMTYLLAQVPREPTTGRRDRVQICDRGFDRSAETCQPDAADLAGAVRT